MIQSAFFFTKTLYKTRKRWYNYSIKSKQGYKMQGSIRMAIGFLIVFGSMGGMDNATDGQLFALVPMALAGLGLMLSGLDAMKSFAK
jgi:hypothetical protein